MVRRVIDPGLGICGNDRIHKIRIPVHLMVGEDRQIPEIHTVTRFDHLFDGRLFLADDDGLDRVIAPLCELQARFHPPLISGKVHGHRALLPGGKKIGHHLERARFVLEILDLLKDQQGVPVLILQMLLKGCNLKPGADLFLDPHDIFRHLPL